MPHDPVDWITHAPDRLLRIAAEVGPHVGRILAEGLSSGTDGTLSTVVEDASSRHFDGRTFEDAHDRLVNAVADLKTAELPEDVGRQLQDAFYSYADARATAALLVGLAVGGYLNPSALAGGGR